MYSRERYVSRYTSNSVISICLSLRGHRPILTKARKKKKKEPWKIPFHGKFIIASKERFIFLLSALLIGAALEETKDLSIIHRFLISSRKIVKFRIRDIGFYGGMKTDKSRSWFTSLFKSTWEGGGRGIEIPDFISV